MTLISTFCANGCPIALGDLLTSSTVRPAVPITVPNLGVLRSPTDKVAARYIAGHAQKIQIIGDRVIFGWAGSLLAARIVASEIRGALHAGALDSDTLDRALAELSASEQESIECFALWIEENRLVGFRHNLIEWKTDSLDNVICGGSGAAFSKEVLANFSARIKGSPNPLERAISTGLHLAGFCHGQEYLSAENLEYHWGGGIEVATFVNKTPTKVGPILYLIWQLDESAEPRLISHIVRVSYIHDITIVKVISNSKHADPEVFDEQNIFVVEPFFPMSTDYRKAANDGVDDWSYQFICSFVIPKNRSLHQTKVVISSFASSGPGVVINSDKEQFRLSFRADYLERITAPPP